jgi:hypothetical protein
MSEPFNSSPSGGIDTEKGLAMFLPGTPRFNVSQTLLLFLRRTGDEENQFSLIRDTTGFFLKVDPNWREVLIYSRREMERKLLLYKV